MDHVIRFHSTIENADVSGGIILYLIKVMCYNDQKLILGDLTQKLDDLLGGCRIKVSGRLVCENNRAIFSKRTCYDSSLLLTAGKLASLLLHV